MNNGTEWLTSNAAVAYPFKDIADFTVWPKSALVDASIRVEGWKQYYLHSLIRSGSTTELTLATGAGADAIVLSVTDMNPADRPYVAVGTTARLVFNAAALMQYVQSLSDGQHIYFGNTLPFEDRTVSLEPPHVKSFELCARTVDGIVRTYADPIKGDVRFAVGYNTGLTADAQSDDSTDITLLADAGAGRGQLPCIDPPILQNPAPPNLGTTPEHGNIQIEGAEDGCYSVTAIPSAGRIQLASVCTACCACEDYEAVVAAIRKISTNSDQVLVQANAAHASYVAGVNQYNSTVVPVYRSFILSVHGLRGAEAGDGRQLIAPNYARIVVQAIIHTSSNVQLMSPITLRFATPAGLMTVDDAAWTLLNTGDKFRGYRTASQVIQLMDTLPSIPAGQTLAINLLVHSPISSVPTGWNCQVEVKTAGHSIFGGTVF